MPFTLMVTEARSGAGPATPSCLHVLGRRLMHALYNHAPLDLLPLLRSRHVLLEAVAVANRQARTTGSTVAAASINAAGLTLPQALVLVASHLQHLIAQGDLSPQTVHKMAAHMGSLSQYLTDGLKQPAVAEVTRDQVAAWIASASGGRRRRGHTPSASTRRLRRSAARLFFRVLRQLGVYEGDPTLDIAVPGADTRITRPLSDDELLLVRYACITEAAETRLPATLALAEATATSGELPGVLIEHCHLDEGRVWLVGTRRQAARWGYLSSWGVGQLRLRIEALGGKDATPSTPIMYSGAAGTGESAQASSCRAIHELLELAGLAGEDAIKPSSIAAATGLRVWKAHHDIGLVAVALGCDSLDTAAKIIGVDPRPNLEQAAPALRGCVLAESTATGVVYQRGKTGRRHGTARKHSSSRKPRRAAAAASTWQAGK